VLCSHACRGSALLVGVGGSGKQSLARFAAMVADCDVFTANVRQGYGRAAFREDVKQLYRVCGNRVCGNRVCGNRVCGNRLCGNRVCGNRVCGNRVCGNRVCCATGCVALRRQGACRRDKSGPGSSKHIL
jgi:hypothetical protein